MRKLILTESEKNEILRLHKISINEELSSFEMLQQIQRAIKTNPDGVIGPDTTKKLVDVLSSIKEPEKVFDYGCVRNNNHIEVIDMTWTDKGGKTQGGIEYQLGDLLFKPNGSYFDLGVDPNKKLSYTCSASTIQTSNHGNIEKENKSSIQTTDNTKKVTTPEKTSETPKIDTTIKPSSSDYTKSDTERLKNIGVDSSGRVTDKFGTKPPGI
jgi:hypothetical protein